MFLMTLHRCLLFSVTLDLANSLAVLKKLITGSKYDVETAERDKAGGDEMTAATDLAVLHDVTLGVDGVPQYRTVYAKG